MNITGRTSPTDISILYMKTDKTMTRDDPIRNRRGIEYKHAGSARHAAPINIKRNVIIVAVIMIAVMIATSVMWSIMGHLRAPDAKLRAIPTKSRVVKYHSSLSYGSSVSRDFQREYLSEKNASTGDGTWTLSEDSEQLKSNLKNQAETQDKAIGIKGKMQGFLNDHKSLDKDKYTSDSWSEWSSNVNAANDLIHNNSLDPSALNAAMNGLSSAYSNLKEMPSSTVSGEMPSSTASGASSPMTPAVPAGDAQSYAQSKVLSRGWSESEFSDLVWLWNRESGWNPSSYNASSGASGIPQCLGHSECQTDAYRSDYRVQVDWGLNYIASRYGSPSAAAQHSKSNGWY
jgi:hypothetical protein